MSSPTRGPRDVRTCCSWRAGSVTCAAGNSHCSASTRRAVSVEARARARGDKPVVRQRHYADHIAEPRDCPAAVPRGGQISPRQSGSRHHPRTRPRFRSGPVQPQWRAAIAPFNRPIPGSPDTSPLTSRQSPTIHESNITTHQCSPADSPCPAAQSTHPTITGYFTKSPLANHQRFTIQTSPLTNALSGACQVLPAV